MMAGNLRDALEDIAIVNDYVIAEATEDLMVFKAEGNMGDARIEFPRGCEAILSLEVKEPSKAMYSLNYLADIVKVGSRLSDLVTWDFSEDMPVRIDFELPQTGKLQYHLAPRIEPE